MFFVPGNWLEIAVNSSNMPFGSIFEMFGKEQTKVDAGLLHRSADIERSGRWFGSTGRDYPVFWAYACMSNMAGLEKGLEALYQDRLY